MSDRIAVSQLISVGTTAIGAGLTGGGVYGALLFHMSIAAAAAIFVCGLVVMVAGLIWRSQIEGHHRP